MVNYKGFQELLTVGGRTVGDPKTIIVLSLETPSTITADSFNDGGTVYQVTAGKTFKAIGLIICCPAATGRIFIHEGDSENAQTILKFQNRSQGNASNIEVPVNFSVAAGKYITGQPSTTTTLTALMIIGYEE